MMRNAGTIAIPAAAGIDYTDADEIFGYHLLLCKVFEREGGLDYPPVNNAITREVRRQGLIWLREVRFLISDILEGQTVAAGQQPVSLAVIPDLLRAYGFICRISNSTPCFDFIRDVKLRTADRWSKGDKSISETDVALLLLSEADRDIQTLDRRYSAYAMNVEDAWIDELVRYGRFISIPLQEAYKRLAYLLNDDLFLYLGKKEKQDTAKIAWVEEYILQNHAELDTRTMLRYIGFLLTASQRGYYGDEPEDELYCRLWAEYISRPDVNPFFRQALEIDLAKYAMA